LNNDYFRDAVYLKLNLNHFGVREFWDGLQLKIRGDVATFAFDVVAFEIGQWSVQDIQENPDDFGRFVRTDVSGGWLDWIYDNLWWLLPAAIVVVLIFVAPWFLVLIISIFR
jgi:hypothetical protein